MPHGHDRRVARRLILLTNEFPRAYGDVTFVQNEIGALAAAFDDVVIFNYPSPGEPQLVSLPSNVRYGGSLKDGDVSPWRALLHPPIALRAARTMVDELRHHRVGRKLKRVLESIAASAGRAAHPQLRQALRGAESVSVYSFWAMGAGMALPCLPRVRGSVALRLHRFDVYEEVLGWLPLRASLLTRPDVLLPISDHAARYLRDTYPWRDRSPIVVSRLGTIDRGQRPAHPETGIVTVVSCSSVSAVKRVDLIAAAMKYVAASVPVRWVHFGDGPLMVQLSDLVRRISSARLAVELRGQAANEEIMRFYRSEKVDVFVNASSSEGVPVSIMEAMSFGVPVVATDVGGVAEIVGGELGSGETVPADATDEVLGDAILRMVREPARRARQVWEKMSDADVNSRVLVEVLTR